MIFLLENSDLQRKDEPWKIFQRLNLVSTHSLGHQSSGLGFATSLSAPSCSGPLGGTVLLRETIRQSADCSFHRLFDPSPLGLRVLEQRVE
ncbi:hypothetical protein H5410_057063 [Solanum commersonii]|uniref:Uncharacterized protein n=1 Tax=Solanum commersonii TaxID=4109 RepID=A0A9J5WLY0_SOLCO|nr:hypothetical protein H5410_057063 [Solanum commersonii]